MKSIISLNEDLFCKMVRFYSKSFQLSPLAAKIYSYLLFDFEKRGVSFDELVEALSCSKSSISTSLHYLVSHQLVLDVAKLDERKRYFVINGEFFKIRFQEIQKMLYEELELIEGLETMSKTRLVNPPSRLEIYKNLIKSNINNIEQNLEQL